MMKRDAAERVQMFAEERASQPQQSDPLDELKALDTEYTELEQQVVKEANIAVKSGRIISSNNISDFDMLVKEMHTSAKQQASDPVKTQEVIPLRQILNDTTRCIMSRIGSFLSTKSTMLIKALSVGFGSFMVAD